MRGLTNFLFTKIQDSNAEPNGPSGSDGFRTDRLGTNVQTYRQYCGFRSGRIGIILADPDRHPGPADPDPYPFQADVKLKFTFYRKFQYTL
jgi:hypothetical protein